MHTLPLISIVTITFNAEKTLKPTMASVAEQTFKGYEHIIIDGASSDRTLDIARHYPEVRILSERDRGLYDAMNKGLALSKGRYIIFLNSGDTFHSPDTLSAYAAKAEQGYDIIYADTIIVNAERNAIGPRHYSAPQFLTHDSFSKGMLICHQAFMVRTAIAPKYDISYRFSADYDWTIRCIKNADTRKCVNLKMTAIDYLSDGLTDHNHFASLRERYSIMAKHYGHARAIRRHLQLLLGRR